MTEKLECAKVENFCDSYKNKIYINKMNFY